MCSPGEQQTLQVTSVGRARSGTTEWHPHPRVCQGQPGSRGQRGAQTLDPPGLLPQGSAGNGKPSRGVETASASGVHREPQSWPHPLRPSTQLPAQWQGPSREAHLSTLAGHAPPKAGSKGETGPAEEANGGQCGPPGRDSASQVQPSLLGRSNASLKLIGSPGPWNAGLGLVWLSPRTCQAPPAPRTAPSPSYPTRAATWARHTVRPVQGTDSPRPPGPARCPPAPPHPAWLHRALLSPRDIWKLLPEAGSSHGGGGYSPCHSPARGAQRPTHLALRPPCLCLQEVLPYSNPGGPWPTPAPQQVPGRLGVARLAPAPWSLVS